MSEDLKKLFEQVDQNAEEIYLGLRELERRTRMAAEHDECTYCDKLLSECLDCEYNDDEPIDEGDDDE